MERGAQVSVRLAQGEQASAPLSVSFNDSGTMDTGSPVKGGEHFSCTEQKTRGSGGESSEHRGYNRSQWSNRTSVATSWSGETSEERTCGDRKAKEPIAT